MKHLPWILLGVGALGVGGVLIMRKKGPASAALPPGPLTPAVQSKVMTQIGTSQDPKLLVQLAAGLQKTGATAEAMKALEKAANITGQPMSVPGAASMPPITVSPGANLPPVTPAATVPTGAPLSSYKVAPGDIPGAIAKRFKLSLSQLAKANGANEKRIMAGKLSAGETLKLPPMASDTGPAARAKGAAA